MKISQFISTNDTRVKNHHVITTDKFVYLQSYDSIVARIAKTTNEMTLGRDWSYSRTTTKYVKQFFEEYMPTHPTFTTKELGTIKVETLHFD